MLKFVNDSQKHFIFKKAIYFSKLHCYNSIHKRGDANLDVVQITSVLVLLVILFLAVAEDFVRMKISNRLILAGLLTALIFQIYAGGIKAVVSYLGNISFPVITLYLLFLAGIIGAGDIKLFSVIGGFVNFTELVQCMLFAFLAGGLICAGKLVFSKTAKVQLFGGFCYLRGLLEGNFVPYDRQSWQGKNLIHFSLPITIGYLIVLGKGWL